MNNRLRRLPRTPNRLSTRQRIAQTDALPRRSPAEWVHEFSDLVLQTPKYSDAWKIINGAAGIGAAVLLRTLFRYTDPHSMTHSRRVNGAAKQLKQRINACLRNMEQTETSIRRRVRLLGNARPDLLRHRLMPAADALRRTRAFLSVAEEDCERLADARGKGRPDYLIISLIMLMRENAGSPHYAEVALLLEAAFNAHQPENPSDDSEPENVTRQSLKQLENYYKRDRRLLYQSFSSSEHYRLADLLEVWFECDLEAHAFFHSRLAPARRRA